MTLFTRLTTRVSAPLQIFLPRVQLDSANYSTSAKLECDKTAEVVLDRGPFSSQLDYQSRLRFNSPTLSYALSGIICTIGPASNKADVLVKLIEAGMRVVRLNFSHGTYDYHCNTIQEARKAVECYATQVGVYKPVAIALDTKGPEIRTGLISGSDTAEVDLKQGDKIKLSTNKDLESNGSKDTIYVDYKQLPKIVKKGNLIFVDDGQIALRVTEATESEVMCEIVNGGKLGSHKGVNLPGIPVDLPSVSEKDKKDLQFGVEHGVDMIFASFIRDAKALSEIRAVLGPKGKHIQIISKIENQQGMHNIDDIIEASDGIMVARGDLGIEILTEEVVLAQKSIIAKCNMAGKPVICATQMLDSMTSKPRPSRAEASDVANAIFDGADCVMLSGETAKGKYPVECVKCMAKICAKVENVLWYERLQNEIKTYMKSSSSDNISAITAGISEIASLGQATAIVVASPCPVVPNLISQFRPRCPIVFLTGIPRVARQATIYRGIYPIVPEVMTNGCKDFTTILNIGLEYMARMKIVDPEKPMTLMIVNALEAERITFRLLYTKKNRQDSKSSEAPDAKAKPVQQTKNEKKKSCHKPTEGVDKCEKQSKEQKNEDECDSDDPIVTKCMRICAKVKKENEDKSCK
ncbi:pyruvate kinase-like [Drosophila navojoa]|uniref:pyruvate kinase-like n=1 Tax=Drosophila navojoa TaxID=7232 RepID=UPI0008471A08|nr:pyruvate kinase-like [Drosophila navojoa]